MAAGRKPKPTYLKILDGNPGKRPLNQDEPKFKPLTPKCPAHLSRDAKKEWRRIVPELESCGLLTIVDMAALAAYCAAYGRWVEAERIIKKHGMLARTSNGYPVVSPFLAIINKSLEQMKAFLTEFGMTPSSRSRISVKAPGQEEDPMEALLRKSGR